MSGMAPATQALLAGTLLFTLTVLALTLFVFGVRRALTPSGKASVLINQQRMLEGELGECLLDVLTEHDIHLPTACGGRRSCGQCRVTVLQGAPPLTAMEADLIPTKQARQGVRLACMLTLRRNLEIQLPGELADARRWRCKVVSSRYVSTLLKEIVLRLPDGEIIDFDAGGYVLVETPPHRLIFSAFEVDPKYRGDWERYGLFDLVSDTAEPVVRAYSLANPPTQNDRVMLIVRLALPPYDMPPGTPPGCASSWLFSISEGDEVWVKGPFGTFRAEDNDREMLLIGGGAGMAPLRSIILDQLQSEKRRPCISFWYGARNLRELCYKQQFDALAERYPHFRWQAALSEPGYDQDGVAEWSGPTGFIHTVVLEQYLAAHPAPDEIDFYICGPPLMNIAVKQMLEDLGIDRQSIYLDDFGGSP